MHVVTGVTGNTGAVVADALLAAREPVRVVVRDPAKAAPWTARGAEAVAADLADADALAAALRGARSAYLLIPPDLTAPDPIAHAQQVAESIATACDRAGLPHAVILSSFAAHRSDAPGMLATTHLFERRMQSIAGRLTVLRAASFMETSAPMVLLGAASGTMPSLVATAVPFEQIAAADFGAIAAQAMCAAHGERRRVIEIAGPRAYSADDMAAAVAAVTGRPTQAVLVPEGGRVPALVNVGMGPAYAAQVVAITDALSAGSARFEGDTPRRGPTTMETWVRRLLAAAPVR